MGNRITRRRTQIDELYTRPQGLYQHKDVDHKKLRRLIIDAKLAPCYRGAEDTAVDLEECPICFLHYPSLNRSKCCTKGICTECFLQVKSPNGRPTQCPFCKTPNYAVEYKGAKTQEEKGVEEAEEQKVIEAKIRIRRQQELQDEEARIQRQEQATQEAQSPGNEEQESGQASPSFPVFSSSAVSENRAVEQTNWPSAGNTAIGYPQTDFFTLRNDSESARMQQYARPLSSSSALSAARPSRRRGAFSNASPGDIPGAPLNREDDFDLDLEDIMVMEAIWLSIQEQQQGSQRPDSSETPFPSPYSDLQYEDTPLEGTETRGRRGSVTGGFASAIAALAERQVASSPSELESNTNSSIDQFQSEETAVDGCKGDKVSVGLEETGNSINGNGLNTENNNNLTAWMREERSSDVLLDQGSEAVEVGTSFSSSIPSASELPWEAPDSGSNGGDVSGEANGTSSGINGSDQPPPPVVPESFEEQMMLAMALSLAEAQKCAA